MFWQFYLHLKFSLKRPIGPHPWGRVGRQGGSNGTSTKMSVVGNQTLSLRVCFYILKKSI